ncbi:ABC transporter ATP-binding protein/permease [Bacillus sp. FJAT-27986]|uniref:ABC transporter ATP-binding protein/permease n=1 Tax=Bacillus sp. FJAT-27986 TaxID=1743146 RepID=UPI00080AC50C|nr:ABC transporter ATP-binding protein/permease [Bacillus sp. FJAT-27986]OCA82631.1 ABC transporter ATP-binding protein [Bacillus sp. FJAT-27986]
MKVLELHHVNKQYPIADGQYFPALKDVNVSFEKGELVSIIGESGSGKSTLMNLIGGLDSDFTGSVQFEGKNIGEFNEKEMDEYRKNKIGFIFQSFNLIPHLSVLDNVTIAMTLSNVGKEERIKRAEEILTQVGLKNHIYKKPNQLSGGQKQRVAIARALINDPEIIIADEPTGALDSETTEQVLAIIKDIAKQGKLVIMVTHSERVANHSSRVIQIADGKIIRDDRGEPLEQMEPQSNQVEKKGGENLSFVAAVKLAFLNMKEKLGRNVWVSLGASIGIMSVIFFLSLGNGVKTYMNDSMNSMVNPLVVEVNMPSEEEELPPSVDENQAMMLSMMGEQTPFEEKDIEKLSEIEHVSSVEKGFNLISFGSNAVKYGDKKVDLMMITTISSNITDTSIKEGTLPGKQEILLAEGTAEKLGGDMIGKDVNVTLMLNEQLYEKTYTVSGIISLGSQFAAMDLIYANYEDLVQLAEDNGQTLDPTSIYLVADNEEFTEDIKAKIKDMGYNGSSQETMTAMMNEMLDVLTYVLTGISGISLFVSAIMILVVLHISVVERTKEIGVLKAIGARRMDIRRIFVSEAFLIGLSSGIIGVLAASLLTFVANSLSTKLIDFEIVQITPAYLVFGVAASIIISMLSGLMPANKAAKLDPVDSLRRE